MIHFDAPLPHDLESEASLLSACVQDTQSLIESSAILTPDLFYSKENRAIFEALIESIPKTPDKPLEFAVVASKLKKAGVSPSVLLKLQETPMAIDIKRIAGLIQEKANIRKTIEVSLDGINRLLGANGNAPEVIEEYKRLIIEATPKATGTKRILSGKPGDVQFYCDTEEAFGNNDKDDKDDKDDTWGQKVTFDDILMTNDDNLMTDDDKQESQRQSKSVYNLASEIKNWIENSSGSFTSDQIDREFCLMSRRDKQNRSNILARACALKQLKKDKRIKGKYHIVDNNLIQIDINDVDETSFPIKLPFYLHQYVSIPKKAIVIIAGTFNAGKTALIMNILKLNLSQKYDRLYLMSEMGTGEYVERLRQFNDVPFEQWKNVTASERSCDFNGAIEHHNRDGLTCIDFLEEVEGEYYKIPSDIRNIYESLNEGVAIIAIQKKTDTDYARGGQATAEKARLYLSVDFLTVAEQSIICALKVIKVKRFIGGRNIQGHEIHFRISEGSKIEPVSEWMRCADVDRRRCIEIYLQPESYAKKASTYCYEFKTDAGRIRGINEKNLNEWEGRFTNIDVKDALEDIANDSFKTPFLKDKSWFFQLSGILAKRNEK